MQELIEAFDLSSIGRSPARFDFAKLENLNGHYMREAADVELVAAIEAILPEIGPARGLGPTFAPELRARLTAAMPGLKERAKTLVDLLDSAYYLYAERPLRLDDKAKGLIAEGKGRLAGIEGKLGAVVDWKAASLEEVVRGHAETVGAKLGQVAQPLRAALTGRATSPGLFDVMAVLGKTESLARVQDQIGP